MHSTFLCMLVLVLLPSWSHTVSSPRSSKEAAEDTSKCMNTFLIVHTKPSQCVNTQKQIQPFNLLYKLWKYLEVIRKYIISLFFVDKQDASLFCGHIQNLDKLLDTVGMLILVLYTLLLSTLFCISYFPVLRLSRDQEGWSRDRTERDRQGGMNVRLDSRWGEMTGSWGTSGDHTPINQDTQPPPLSITCLSIYNNMMFHSPLPWPRGPAPVNAAEPESNWNIVWIQFSGINIWLDWIWLSASECIIIPTSVIWWLNR